MNLNYKLHRDDLLLYCTLCNHKARKDIFHFIAICPLFREIRKIRIYFENAELTLERMLDVLNGNEERKQLIAICKGSATYRAKIVILYNDSTHTNLHFIQIFNVPKVR